MLEFLIVGISFLGLVFGGMLALISPEEMKEGERWFKILRKVVVSFLILSLAFFVIPNFYILIIGGIVGFVAAKFLFDKIYFYLGLAVFASLLTFVNEYIILITSLVFIFGFPEGTLRIGRLKTKNWDVLKRLSLNFLFFIVPFLLYLSKEFFVTNIAWVLAFTGGGVLCLMEKQTYLEVLLKTSKGRKS